MRNRAIIRKACKFLGIEPNELMSDNRSAVYVEGRLLISYSLMKKGLDMEDIALALNRNRTTIYHYLQEVDNRMKYDSVFKNKMRLYEKIISI